MAIETLRDNSYYHLRGNQLYFYSDKARNHTIRTICRHRTNTKMSICRKTGSYVKEEFFNKDDFKIFGFNFQNNFTPYHKESVLVHNYILSDIARVSNIVLGRAFYSYGFSKFFNTCVTFGFNTLTVKNSSHDT